MRRWLLLGLIVCLGACRPAREAPPPEPALPVPGVETPAGYTRYEVVSRESEIRVLVYRDGPLARLGHNHVVSLSRLHGDVVVDRDLRDPRVDLRFAVADLDVDRPELRATEGADFVAPVDDEARAGTTSNMRGPRVLNQADYPAVRITGSGWQAMSGIFQAEVTLRGAKWPLAMPITVERAGRRLVVRGELHLRHAQLGLEPFTALGGMLAVKDEFVIRFRITAQPLAAATAATAAVLRPQAA
jgi:hypothetical protein